MSSKTDFLRNRFAEFFKKQAYGKALKEFILIKKEGTVDKEIIDAVVYIGNLHIQDSPIQAIQILNLILECQPSDDTRGFVHAMIAQALVNQKKQKKAIQYIESAYKISPNHSGTLFKITESLFALQLVEEALKILTKLKGFKDSKLEVSINLMEARCMDFIYNNKNRNNINIKSFIIPDNLKISSNSKTILLNLGFAKCGSTFIQSRVFPYLPLLNYYYAGTFYTNNRIGTIEAGLGLDKELNSSGLPFLISKLGKSSSSDQDIFNFISKKMDENDIISYSCEVLPDKNEALKIAKFLEKNFQNINFIYLVTHRNPLDAFWSGYCHKAIEYAKQNQGRVISLDEYRDGSMGIKFRCLSLERFEFGRILTEFSQEVRGSIVTCDISRLTTSASLWSNMFSRIQGSSDVDNGLINLWMEHLKSTKPLNKKTELAKKVLGIKQSSISDELRKFFHQIEMSDHIQYKMLGNNY